MSPQSNIATHRYAANDHRTHIQPVDKSKQVFRKNIHAKVAVTGRTIPMPSNIIGDSSYLVRKILQLWHPCIFIKGKAMNKDNGSRRLFLSRITQQIGYADIP